MRNQEKRDASHDLSLTIIQVSIVGIIVVLVIVNLLNNLM